MKAPRREWVHPRYVVHSVRAQCGHTVFVRFWYWIETAIATVLTVLAWQGKVVSLARFSTVLLVFTWQVNNHAELY